MSRSYSGPKRNRHIRRVYTRASHKCTEFVKITLAHFITHNILERTFSYWYYNKEVVIRQCFPFNKRHLTVKLSRWGAYVFYQRRSFSDGIILFHVNTILFDFICLLFFRFIFLLRPTSPFRALVPLRRNQGIECSASAPYSRMRESDDRNDIACIEWVSETQSSSCRASESIDDQLQQQQRRLQLRRPRCRHVPHTQQHGASVRHLTNRRPTLNAAVAISSQFIASRPLLDSCRFHAGPTFAASSVNRWRTTEQEAN